MSHLQVDPSAPWYIHAAADALLVLHIGGGTVGLLAGATALAARKGGTLHARAGTVFFGAMLTMAGVGATVAPVMGDRPSTVAGILTLYLLLSAWLTVRRRAGEVGQVETVAAVVPVGIALMGAVFMWMAAHSRTGTVDDQPDQSFYLFAIVGAIAAAGDLRMILRRGISGVQRIARHLWRMCTALFVASGSLFLGQSQIFPAAIRHTPILYILALAPLGFLIFWMLRVRLTKAFRPAPAAQLA